MQHDPSYKIFSIGKTRSVSDKVCEELGTRASEMGLEKFPDGEMKIRPLENVIDKDVFVFQTLGGDGEASVNDRICQLYFLLSSLRDEGARSLTAVIPYLSYARSDQKKENFDPLTNLHLAEMLSGIGLRRIIGLDVHNVAAFENAYKCNTLNLEAAPLFIKYLLATRTDLTGLCVLSPDFGGIKRVEKFKRSLHQAINGDVSSAFIEKFRTHEGISGHRVSGEIKGRNVIILDDMISTGGTVLKSVEACERSGAASISVFATHGLFCQNREEFLNHPHVDEIVVTDTHPLLQEIDIKSFPKLIRISCAPLFSQSIRYLKGMP